MKRPPLGVHASIAGGYPRALERGAALGCEALQIFVKSPGQWRLRPLAEGEAQAFRAAHAASPIGPLIAHGSYLINLASGDPALAARSRRCLGEELERCARLGVEALVIHPGAHCGDGAQIGIERVAAALDEVLARRPGCPVKVALENTAGQGSTLGRRLEELAAIFARVDDPRRLAVCIDVCHAFAAGYPLHRRRGLDELLGRLDELIGLEHLAALHVNDSARPFGSRLDRHANLGEGEIGLAAFGRLVREPRLAALPMILETPKGGDGEEGYRRDLTLLRRRWRRPRAAPECQLTKRSTSRLTTERG